MENTGVILGALNDALEAAHIIENQTDGLIEALPASVFEGDVETRMNRIAVASDIVRYLAKGMINLVSEYGVRDAGIDEIAGAREDLEALREQIYPGAVQPFHRQSNKL